MSDGRYNVLATDVLEINGIDACADLVGDGTDRVVTMPCSAQKGVGDHRAVPRDVASVSVGPDRSRPSQQTGTPSVLTLADDGTLRASLSSGGFVCAVEVPSSNRPMLSKAAFSPRARSQGSLSGDRTLEQSPESSEEDVGPRVNRSLQATLLGLWTASARNASHCTTFNLTADGALIVSSPGA